MVSWTMVSGDGGSTQILQELLILRGAALFPGREQGGPENPHVGQAVQPPQVGAGAETEAQGERQGCDPATARHKGFQTSIEMRLPAGDALARDTIHKASRIASNLLQARQRVGGGHENNR